MFANIVIWALFALCRICKTNHCNSALRPETSQGGEIQPWRNTMSLLCSWKWCWVNGSLHSGITPCLWGDLWVHTDIGSPQHVCLCPCWCTAWSCTGWGALADWSSLGCIVCMCVGNVPASRGKESNSSSLQWIHLAQRRPEWRTVPWNLPHAPASLAPGHCSLSCYLLRPENSLPSFILLPWRYL